MKFKKAINTENGIPLAIALNIELQLQADGTVPDWIQLLPAGTEIKGRDGRTWINDQPAIVLAAFTDDGKDLPIDWEHSSEKKAPYGDPAPAAGWIKQMEIRNGETWVQVQWTPRAIEQIKNREYRYISPVFVYEKATLRIVRITSAGLTNQPNLYLTALNNENKKNRKENISMELVQLLAALGLPATATFAEALNSISRIKQDYSIALNRVENPSLDKFVPRADYDKVVEKATNAEKALKDKADAELEKDINTEIDAALKAGKITPATTDYHKAQCRTEGGLDRFKQFVAAAPVIGDNTDLDNKKHGGDSGIDADQKAINSMCGVDDETFKKYGKTEG
ncbi:MAG: phage protease [Smithella sp.]